MNDKKTRPSALGKPDQRGHFCRQEEEERRKWRRIVGDIIENIFLAEKKRNREGRGVKYLEKKNISQRRRRAEKEERGGRYLEMENIFLAEENKERRIIFLAEEKENGEGRGGKSLENENIFCGGEEQQRRKKRK